MKKLNQRLTHLLIALAILLALPATTRAGEWTGNGATLNWSDTGNWDTASVPTAASYLYFSDVFYPNAYTNAAGVVNNVVDGNHAAGTAIFNALSSGPLGNRFYTTLIPAGNTLTLGGLGGTALAVGDEPGIAYASGSGATNHTSFTGSGTLALNDAFSILSVGTRNRATLDLSTLNTLTANLISVRIGADPYNSLNFGITGWLNLARTNTITTAASPSAPGVLLGHLTNATGTATVRLGAANNINTDSLIVGGRRSSTTLSFQPEYMNSPSPGNFVLRGSAGGSTAIATFAIGDASANADGYNTAFPGTTTSATGTADFSGANVDIRADSIYVGRASSAQQVASGTGNGTLIVEQGTVSATNLYIGYKPPGSTNASVGQGVVTLRSNAVMNVYGNVALVYRTNSTTFLSESRITVNDDAVLNIGGDLITTHTLGNWVQPSVSLGGGTINLTGGGIVFVPGLLGQGLVTNASSITVSNTLVAGGLGTAGTLVVGDNLTLGSLVKPFFDLGANTTVGGGVNDYVSVLNNVTFNNNPITLTYSAPLVVGTYSLIGYGGTQSGSVTWANPTRSPIGLVQGAGQVAIVVTNLTPATLTWRATGAGANWESTSLNWNNNTEKFFTFDHVVFDDTGVATNITIASITNLPASITFNNTTKTYTFTQSGSGAIGGYGGLTKNGTGLVVIGAGGANNYFTGPINLNAGTLRIGSFNSGVFGTTAATTPINIAAGATLDTFGNGYGSGNSYGRAINVAGTGVDGNGAIIHLNATGSGNPSINTAGITLTGDTLVAVTGTKALNFTGLFAPYSSELDLGGFTLSTAGAGEARIVQMVLTNGGTINVGGRVLAVRNSIISGTGSINVGDNILSLGGNSAFTTGYVAKAISVGNGALIAPNVNAYNIPLSSPISIANGGALNITNSQIILASGIISGNGALNKYGNSNLVLSAANAYTGATTVGAGTLQLAASGSLASTAINVETTLDVTEHGAGYTLISGQTLSPGASGTILGNIIAGNGSVAAGFGWHAGSVTVAAGGKTAPGSALTAGTLTVANNLVYNGGTASFKLTDDTTPGSGINDLVTVGNNLTFTAPTTIQILPVGSISASAYTLFTYGGALSGMENVTVTSSLRPGTTYTIDTNTPGVVLVYVTSASANLVWSGGAAGNPNAWNINTTSNWNNGGLPDYFFQGDQVTFDDTAVTSVATINSQIQPAAMTNNASGTMMLGGSGNLLAGNLVANSGNFQFANANNNVFNGTGISLNGGSVSFNQPTAATVTARFSGGVGSIEKNGANTLTLVSTDSTNLAAPVNINSGTLRPVGFAPLGSGLVTILNGATLDLNGVMMSGAGISARGAGVDGQGAINNRGQTETNAVGNLTLTGPTTIGAASNRWDVSTTLLGNGHSLTKQGAADIWIRTGNSTGLGDIEVGTGRLIFAVPGTDLGDSSTSTLVVRSNAVVGFAQSVQAGTKPGYLAPGASVYVRDAANRYDGSIVLSNGLIQMEPNGGLTLGGNLTGPATLHLRGVAAGNFGSLTLEGSNSYSGGTLITEGLLVVANQNSLPGSSNVVLASRVAYNTSGHPILQLGDGVISPNGVLLDMQTFGLAGAAQATLTGNGGTWAGPIRITGANNNCVAVFSAGQNGLTVNGAIDATGFVVGSGGNGGFRINGEMANVTSLQGAAITLNSPLIMNAPISCNNWQNLGGNMTKLVLNGATNYWTSAFFNSGMIQIGVDNAIPTLSPITVNNLFIGADHRFVIDLNGHSQALGSFAHGAGGPAEQPVWFGNSSTNTDATLVHIGSGTNTWSAFIVDAFDPGEPNQKKTHLTVSSGYLRLVTSQFTDPNNDNVFPAGAAPGPMTNTYSGPTLVTGGTLQVDTGIPNSAVTVSGTGRLKGTGSLGGPVLISAGGTLAPGASIGTLTITSNLTLAANSTTEIEVDTGAALNDQVVGINQLTLGGTLAINNIGSQSFSNGMVLQLFSANSYIAGAVTISPGSPGAGLAWDASDLAVNGTLKVVPGAPLISGAAKLPSGNIGLTLTGYPGTPYSVRASTNVALPLVSWQLLTNGVVPASSWLFTDLAATNYPRRFYRTSNP